MLYVSVIYSSNTFSSNARSPLLTHFNVAIHGLGKFGYPIVFLLR